MKSYNNMGAGDANPEGDWSIECSDDEKYNPTQERKGVWQPKPEDIINLFEKLEKDQYIELRWQCPGRRPPDSEKEKEQVTEQVPEKEVLAEQPKEEDKKPVVPSEFDFDDMDSVSTVITPRRTPGSSKTPKSVKKVARMDKVLNDIKRQRDADREARRSMLGRSPLGSPARSLAAQSGLSIPFHPTTSMSNMSSPMTGTSINQNISTPARMYPSLHTTQSDIKTTESGALSAPGEST